MLLTPHTFVGTAIAASVPNMFISVPLSFVMHFFGDKVPHWDFFTGSKIEERRKGWRLIGVMGDLALGVAVGMFFTLYALWIKHDSALAINIFLCGVASNLPDAFEVPRSYFDSKNPVVMLMYKIQHAMQFRADLPWGIISQLVVVLVCLVLLSNSLLQG
jgi:hypothetical protein